MRKLWWCFYVLGWLSLAGLLVWLWVLDPLPVVATAGQLDPIIQRDLAYRMDALATTRLDVYLPANPSVDAGASGLLPGVLAIHGGSWIGGSKSEYGPQVARLTRHGYVVFAADYQLARPGQPSWPGALEDLREAIRWIRRHANEFRVDPTRLVALGSGSGAHLALLLGTFPSDHQPENVSSRVQAVVSMYGPSDLLDLVAVRSLTHEPARRFLGEDSAEWLTRARDASPLEHVSPNGSPALLVHGSDDRWVPLDQSRRMAKSLSLAGVPERLVVVNGARHGFELFVQYPETKDLLPEVLAFLDSVWQAPLRNHR
jgi:acetyl esterase/lipase